MTDEFIEACAARYFNGCTKSGVPFYQVYTFEQFVNLSRGGE